MFNHKGLMVITNTYLSSGKYCAFTSDRSDQSIKKWPDEKGERPDDRSIGYYDHETHGRLHVFPTKLLIYGRL